MSGSSEERPHGRIWAIVLDCVDAERAADFWSELLDLEVTGRYEEYVWLEEVAPGIRLVLQEVPDPKLAKNRVHFDIAADDFDAFVSRAETLGGTQVEYIENPAYALLVMTDPDGNEFCVNRRSSGGADQS